MPLETRLVDEPAGGDPLLRHRVLRVAERAAGGVVGQRLSALLVGEDGLDAVPQGDGVGGGEVEGGRENDGIGDVRAAVVELQLAGGVGMQVAGPRETGHAAHRVADTAVGAAGVHAHGAADGGGDPGHLAQPLEAAAGRVHEGLGHVGAAHRSHRPGLAGAVVLDLAEGGEVEAEDDAVDPVVADEQVGAAAEDPQGGARSVTALDQGGQPFDAPRPHEQVRPAPDAVPGHGAERRVGDDVGIEIAQQAREARADHASVPDRAVWGRAASKNFRATCHTGPAPMITTRSPSRAMTSSCSTIASKG